MTNDELLSKLLDNTLTETERQELDVRMTASPQFAEEVREYLAVEDMLFKTRASLPTAPTRLFTSVEQQTAAVIATAAATTATTETTVRTLLTGRLLGAAATVLLGGAALWYIVSSGTATTPAVQPVAQHHSTEQQMAHQTPAYSSAPQQPKEDMQQEHMQSQLPSAQVAVEHQESRQTQQAPARRQQADNRGQQSSGSTTAEGQQNEQQTAAAASGSSNVNADKTDVNETKKELNRQLDEYALYKSNGNTIRLSLAAKKVGITYRALDDFDNSRLYLEEALALTRAQHLAEEEAIITGELGLLEKKRGAVEQAEELLQNCIKTLRTLNSTQVQRWQDELALLQKQQTK